MSKEELARKGSVPARLAKGDYQCPPARPLETSDEVLKMIPEPSLKFTLASDEIEIDMVIARVTFAVVIGRIRVIQFPAVHKRDLIIVIVVRDVREVLPEGFHQKTRVI